MSEKARESQSYIDDLLVARMLIDFKRHHRDVYPDDVMINMFSAVGPMQTFLGYLIKEGHLKLPDEPAPFSREKRKPWWRLW